MVAAAMNLKLELRWERWRPAGQFNKQHAGETPALPQKPRMEIVALRRNSAFNYPRDCKTCHSLPRCSRRPCHARRPVRRRRKGRPAQRRRPRGTRPPLQRAGRGRNGFLRHHRHRARARHDGRRDRARRRPMLHAAHRRRRHQVRRRHVHHAARRGGQNQHQLQRARPARTHPRRRGKIRQPVHRRLD